MDEEDIAKYKIIKLGEALENLEIHLPSLATVLRGSESVIEGSSAAEYWALINPWLRILKISIRKPTERITSIDELEWLEVLKRFNYRSCGNPICISAPHCTECGLHGSTMKDGHDCVPKRINFE